MDTCRTCATRGADQCAAIWNYDAHMIAGLRGGAQMALRSGVSQISIAQFLIVLCRDEAAQRTLRAMGADPRALEHDLAPLVVPPSVRTSGPGRVVLSEALNALLLAAEQTAYHANRPIVSLDVLTATLIENAAHDPAAGVFYQHVSIASRQPRATPSQAYAGTPPSRRTQLRSDQYRQRMSPVGPGAHNVAPPSRTPPSTAMGGLSRARTRDMETRSESVSWSKGSSLASTGSSSRLQREGDHAARTAQLKTTEQEHYETILRMLRVQEARLEHLEAGNARTRSGFSRNGLKIRKVAFGSKSGRDGQRSTSTTGSKKRQSQSQFQSSQRSATTSFDVGSAHEHTRGRDRSFRSNRDYNRDHERYNDRARERDRHTERSRDRNHRDDRGCDYGQYRSALRETGQTSAKRAWTHSDRSDRELLERERPTHSTSMQTRTERTDGKTKGKKEKRFYLSLEDDLVDAPSIGPKTAARFTPLGIHTVQDLLELDVESVAAQLKVRHISADVLRDWQDQARLVCTVPWLRGTHAQLLVGADYRSAGELAKADLGEVLAGILRFSSTSQGERVLRTNPPPEREKVATWLGFAKQADTSRVA